MKRTAIIIALVVLCVAAFGYTPARVLLGAARPAFLVLSRQAFPQDKALAALKTS